MIRDRRSTRSPRVKTPHPGRTSTDLLFVCAIAIVCALAAPAAALGDIAGSTNWAGYAVHRPGLSFRQVSGRWRQPQASCTPGHITYSAYWVGLGGFNPGPPSSPLEQAGSEADCLPDGRPNYYAWLELVPSPPVNLPARKLRVFPGDLISTSVTVVGHKVTIVMRNDTRHQQFRKVLRPKHIDVSSAEWIVEAPSGCGNHGLNCTTLPLTDFSQANFSLTRAQANGHALGSITDPFWDATKILLCAIASQCAGNPSAIIAAPTALGAYGRSFKVTYSARTPVLRARASAAGLNPVR